MSVVFGQNLFMSPDWTQNSKFAIPSLEKGKILGQNEGFWRFFTERWVEIRLFLTLTHFFGKRPKFGKKIVMWLRLQLIGDWLWREGRRAKCRFPNPVLFSFICVNGKIIISDNIYLASQSNSLSCKFSIWETVATYFRILMDWIAFGNFNPTASSTLLTTDARQSFPLRWFKLFLVGAANTYLLFVATPTAVLVFISMSIASTTSGVRMIGTLLPLLPRTYITWFLKERNENK